MRPLLFLPTVVLLGAPVALLACGGGMKASPASDSGTSLTPESGAVQQGDGGGSIVVTDEGGSDAGQWQDASPPMQLGAGGSAVATTGPTNVWVTGNGPILQYDGSSWASVFNDDISTFGSIWANSATDAWAVGYYPGPNSMLAGSIAHWNGTAWADVMDAPATNQLFDVWASSPSDVWVVGDEVVGAGLQAIILHFDGSTWTTSYTEAIQDFGRIWGSGPDDVWAAGLGDTVHYDGHSWSKGGPTSSTVGAFGVWGTGPSDVWAWGADANANGSLFHYDGTSWSAGTPIGASLSLSAMWGSSPTDIWAVGEDGSSGYDRALMMHFDGDAWSILPQAASAPVLSAVAGSGPDNIWCAGEAVVRLK
jgi:hypothetical protein